MVILDKVVGSTIDQILAQDCNQQQGPEAPKVEDLVMNKDLKSLDEAIAAMREGHFIHGNLHPPNVVLHDEPDGSRKAYIINFDWAGVEGEAQYLEDIVLNPDVKWPHDPMMMPGELILASDDNEMCTVIL